MFHPTIINLLIYVDGYIILIVITSKKSKYKIMLYLHNKKQKLNKSLWSTLAFDIRKMTSVVYNELDNSRKNGNEIFYNGSELSAR